MSISCRIVFSDHQQEEHGLDALYVDTTHGRIGLLSHHAPLLAQLKSQSQLTLKRTNQSDLLIELGPESYLKFENNHALVISN